MSNGSGGGGKVGAIRPYLTCSNNRSSSGVVSKPRRLPARTRTSIASSHSGLPSDLDRLAKLIVDHLPALQNDTLNYVATDVTEARANAVTIRTAYNSTATAKWTDRARRVFALLDDSYSEVRAAAQFILRHEPAAEERFVPLRQAGTGRPRRLNTDASAGEVVNTTAPITPPTPGTPT